MNALVQSYIMLAGRAAVANHDTWVGCSASIAAAPGDRAPVSASSVILSPLTRSRMTPTPTAADDVANTLTLWRPRLPYGYGYAMLRISRHL